MIRDDQEFTTTQERIAYFQALLARLRVTARPEEFPLVARGYASEIERMQTEVMQYLTRHAAELAEAG